MPKGRCTNFDKPCPKHVDEEIIEVPKGADFVCPECGRELMAVSGGASMSERIVAAASDGKTLAGGAVIIVLIGIGGWMLTGSGNESATPPDTSSKTLTEDTVASAPLAEKEVSDNASADASSSDREKKGELPSEQSDESEKTGGETTDATSEEETDEEKTDEKQKKMGSAEAKSREERPTNRNPDCGGEEAAQNQVEYPDFAEKTNIEGRIVVRFDVDKEGNVVNTQVADGSENQLLRRAAIDAVRGLNCKPGYKNGNPEKMRMELPVVFQTDRF